MKIYLAGLFLALMACGDDRGITNPSFEALSGVWKGSQGNLELRASDSAIVADKGVMASDAESIWFADQNNIYQMLKIDYVSLKLDRANNPTKYVGTAWHLALVYSSLYTYHYTLSQESMCFEVKSSRKCFTR